MKTNFIIFCLILLSSLSLASDFPERITCKTRIALNRTLSVELHRPSKELIVTADSGSRWEGIASKYFSVTSKRETYNVSFFNYANSSPDRMALEIDPSGDHRLCITQTECFICR